MSADAARPAYDPEALTRLARFGGPAFLGEMVELFAHDVVLRLDNARRAFADGDIAGVEAVMHSLKSSAAQLGLTLLSTLCADAEVDCRAGISARLPALLQALDAELPRGVEWMRKTFRESYP